jgi:hypothetical protein
MGRKKLKIEQVEGLLENLELDPNLVLPTMYQYVKSRKTLDPYFESVDRLKVEFHPSTESDRVNVRIRGRYNSASRCGYRVAGIWKPSGTSSVRFDYSTELPIQSEKSEKLRQEKI